MKIIRNGVEIELAPEEIYQAYQEQELEFRTRDAKMQASFLELEDKLTDEDFKMIGQLFINQYDCNMTENDLFEKVIGDYMKTDFYKEQYAERQQKKQEKIEAFMDTLPEPDVEAAKQAYYEAPSRPVEEVFDIDEEEEPGFFHRIGENIKNFFNRGNDEEELVYATTAHPPIKNPEPKRINEIVAIQEEDKVEELKFTGNQIQPPYNFDEFRFDLTSGSPITFEGKSKDSKIDFKFNLETGDVHFYKHNTIISVNVPPELEEYVRNEAMKEVTQRTYDIVKNEIKDEKVLNNLMAARGENVPAATIDEYITMDKSSLDDKIVAAEAKKESLPAQEKAPSLSPKKQESFMGFTQDDY